MKDRIKSAATICGAAALLACACARPPAALPPPAPTPELLPPPPCERIVAIEVSKRERRLRARCEGGAVGEMTVALGRASDRPKPPVGDARTPEGHYRIPAPPRPRPFPRLPP